MKKGMTHGHGALHSGKRQTIPSQPERNMHSKNGRLLDIKSILSQPQEDRQPVTNCGGQLQNMKLVSGEWTRKMDIGPGCGPNFAFTHVPSLLPEVNPCDCYPVPDESRDMRDVRILHEGSYNDEAYLKPLSRTRKPSSDCTPFAYGSSAPAARSVSMRDMGTEMTPIASQEPSRTGTPIRATTPALRSPMSSCMSSPRQGSAIASPLRCAPNGTELGNERMMASRHAQMSGREAHSQSMDNADSVNWPCKEEEEEADASKLLKNIDLEDVRKNVLETRALAWEEAEQTKYLARFKREEAKILAWENHEKAKAEAELRRIEVKAEKLRSRAHEKLIAKIAAAKQRAERRHATAQAKQCEQASKAAHRADYIQRTGRMPSSFFRFSICH